MPTRVATTIASEVPRPHIVVITLEDGAVYGNDAVLANYERWNEAWEGAENPRGGDRARRPGVPDGSIPRPWSSERVEVDTRLYEVYTLRDGKVLRIDEYEHRADALEAAGLSE